MAMTRFFVWVGLLTALGIGSIAFAGEDFGSGNVDCNDTEADFRNAGAAGITVGNRNIYAGYDQITGINQNPVIAAYDAVTGERVFCRADYEQTGVDGRAAALHYNGEQVYVYIRVDGGFTGQIMNAEPSDNVRSWTRSVGPANSGNFAYVAGINTENGNLEGAAFITAVLTNGNANSVGITGFECTETGRVRILADSFFNPRKINGQKMTQTVSGSSPFDYTIEFTPDLLNVTYTAAIGWEADGTSSSVIPCPDSSLSAIGGNLDVVPDGVITLQDALFVVNRVGQPANNNPTDVNGDNTINAADAQAVLRQIGVVIP